MAYLVPFQTTLIEILGLSPNNNTLLGRALMSLSDFPSPLARVSPQVALMEYSPPHPPSEATQLRSRWMRTHGKSFAFSAKRNSQSPLNNTQTYNSLIDDLPTILGRMFAHPLWCPFPEECYNSQNIVAHTLL